MLVLESVFYLPHKTLASRKNCDRPTTEGVVRFERLAFCERAGRWVRKGRGAASPVGPSSLNTNTQIKLLRFLAQLEMTIIEILKPHVAIGYVGARQVQDDNTKAWILDPVSPKANRSRMTQYKLLRLLRYARNDKQTDTMTGNNWNGSFACRSAYSC